MRYRVLRAFKVKTPQGERELQAGEVITLRTENAIELINRNKITPMGRVAIKLYSEILETSLWVVYDDTDARELSTSGDVIEAIYTAEEVRKLKGMSRDALRAIHQAKEAFPEAVVIERGKERQKNDKKKGK